jgi:hypothetical protein
MHAKFRRNAAHLYRSHWTPKGAAGNTHGYASQEYVGSLALTCTVVPEALVQLLSDDERRYVDDAICRPARESAIKAKLDAEVHEADPSWRLEQAIQLIREAADRGAGRRVSKDLAHRLSHVVSTLQSEPAVAPSSPKEQPRPDAMEEALRAVQAATSAVRAGTYGSAPDTGARNTRTYRVWMQIYEAVCGRGDESLMRALQARGFAKSRQQ